MLEIVQIYDVSKKVKSLGLVEIIPDRQTDNVPKLYM